MATTDRSHALPPPRPGFTRFSNTAVDIRWADCPVGFELFGRWQGWRPSADASWNPLGAMEIEGATKVFPLVTALRILMRVPPGTPLALVYLGKRPSKRGGKAYHDFALDYPDGTVLLPESDADNAFAPRELPTD